MQGLRQDVTLALDRFYQASVVLTLTLHLDPTVTLVPRWGRSVDDPGARGPAGRAAARDRRNYRPDLEAVPQPPGAVHADTGDVLWGGLGPQVQAGYTYGGIQAERPGQRPACTNSRRRLSAAASRWAFRRSGRSRRLGPTSARRPWTCSAGRPRPRRRRLRPAGQPDPRSPRPRRPAATRGRRAGPEARTGQPPAGTLLTVDVLQTQNEADLPPAICGGGRPVQPVANRPPRRPRNPRGCDERRDRGSPQHPAPLRRHPLTTQRRHHGHRGRGAVAVRCAGPRHP